MFEQSFEEAMKVARDAGRAVAIRADSKGVRSGTVKCDQFTLVAFEGLYGRVGSIIYGLHSSFAPGAGE